MTIGLFFTALVLGLRHGVDWDHIAAIADLSGAAENRRRGLWLSFLYAVGHAVVVFVLGSVAVLAGAAIPDGLDVWMGRIVGLTLVWLGIWVVIELVRHGRDFRLRSRWMLVLDGTFAGFRRVARMAGRRQIEVRHDHPHTHDAAVGGRRHPADHEDHDSPAHELDHSATEGDLVVAGRSPSALEPNEGAGEVGRRFGRRHGRSTRIHTHPHRHVAALPARFDGSSSGAATGIGMLHGVGVESPTQIAVFVASTSVVGRTAGFVLLGAWCVGLVLANTGLALLAGFGLLEARRNFAIYATVAVTVAVGSIAMGLLYLFGLDILPAIEL